MPNKYISKIKQSGVDYNVKDTEARTTITTVAESNVNATVDEESLIFFLGKTYDYQQDGTEVTLTNAPYTKEGSVVTIQ